MQEFDLSSLPSLIGNHLKGKKLDTGIPFREFNIKSSLDRKIEILYTTYGCHYTFIGWCGKSGPFLAGEIKFNDGYDKATVTAKGFSQEIMKDIANLLEERYKGLDVKYVIR